jgi:hypothetical protein
MLEQRGAIVPQILWQLDAMRILNLGGLQQRRQHCGGREVCDRKRISHEIRTSAALLLDPVERSGDGGTIGFQLRVADVVTEAIEGRENSP